jgi:hypothetical protein
MLFVLLFLITACQNTGIHITDIKVTAAPKPAASLEPYTFKTSLPGKATLHGTLVILDPTMLPAAEDPVYLVPLGQSSPTILNVPEFNTEVVPRADVDERTGEFVFTNIDVGYYTVVVVSMGGSQIPARTMDTARNLVIVKVNTSYLDKTTEIGMIGFP